MCILVSSCKESSATEETIEMLTAEEIEQLSKLEDVQLIDVRTKAEFGDEHLKNAQNIVFDEHFSEKIEELDKTKPVIVYCKSGGRSEKSAQILQDSGFTKIYDLKGGISQWKYAQKKTVKDSL